MLRRETSRCFRNKKKEYLKDKIDEHELTVRPRMSEMFIGASVILRRVSSLERIR